MGHELPSTETSLLEAAVSQDPEQLNAAFRQFLDSYGPGLCSILTRSFGPVWGHAARAEQLVQDFVHYKVYEKELIAGFLERRAGPRSQPSSCSPREFRKLLVTSLCNYVRTKIKQVNALQEHEQKAVGPTDVAEHMEDYLAVEKFRKLAVNVLGRTRDHYGSRGKQQHWDLFVRLRIEPAICQTKPPSYEDLAREFGLDLSNAKNKIARVEDYLRNCFSKVVQQDLRGCDPIKIPQEIEDIRAGLLRAISKPDLLTALPGVPTQTSLDLSQADPSQLSSLMSIFDGRFDEHSDTELRALYRYWMSSRLSTLFEELDRRPPPSLVSSDNGPKDYISNLEELITLPKPPMNLVSDLKTVFSQLTQHRSPLMPRRVALALRFLMIGLVIVRYPNQPLASISSLAADELAQGLRHVLAQSWVDEASREILEGAVGRLA